MRQDNVKLLYHYAEKVGLNKSNVDADRMNESYGRLLFKSIVTDYQNGQVSVDDFSALCELVYQKLEGTDLFELLLNGAEIEWYMRWNPEVGATYIRDLINEFGTKWLNPKVSSEEK